jgi:hypothetical protein
MIRLILEFLVVVLVFRIIRALYRALFPPIDRREGYDRPDSQKHAEQTDYKDVQEAKYKDI